MAANLHRLVPALGLVASVALLSGCSGADVSRAFGLSRSVPDEYTVTTRAPLSMPPSEDLSSPNAGASRPQDENPRQQALETLAPELALKNINGTPSAGQSALVGAATEASNAPNNGELGRAGDGFVNQLMFWKGGQSGAIVDATAENQRLKANSALGNNPTTGVTPTEKTKKSSFLGIF